MFSCRDATSLMTDERDGRLSGWVRLKYRSHMLICVHCKAFRRQIDETIAIVKETGRTQIPRETEDELVEAFRARAGRSDVPRR